MRLFSSLLAVCCAFAQTYAIQTFAGGGLPVNIPGTAASLRYPESVAVDSGGNLFFAAASHVVLRLDAATGVLTLVAGNGTPGFSGDNGPAADAQLDFPHGVALDSAGSLYIADVRNNRVRKVAHGIITTVAGSGPVGYGTGAYSGDNGPAAGAQLSLPAGVAVDSAGNLYIADYGNNRIRRVSGGMIATVAGGGAAGYGSAAGFGGDNGPAISALLNAPSGVAVDSAGNLYIADTSNHRIREVSNGVIATIAGTGSCAKPFDSQMGCFGGDNGPAASAQLNYPGSVAVDSAGNLYIADTANHRIRTVSNGVIATMAGDGSAAYGGDGGPAVSAHLDGPNGVVLDFAGNLYIADASNNRIRRVTSGLIATVAGNGTAGDSGDNGPAGSAQLSAPYGVAVDPAGSLYFAQWGDYRVRKVLNGAVAAVAGDGTTGYSGDDGPAIGARFNKPYGIAADSAGNLYIADTYNFRVRKVSNGVITTVAGTGQQIYSGDNGPATSAGLFSPTSVAVDSAGNLYIADTGSRRIRKVSNGMITTVAGNGSMGYSGDNGPATSAELWEPYGIALDSAGSLYIADTYNNRIRKVSNGVITTVAGNGTPGYGGDGGPATSAELNNPYGVAVDAAGNIFIADPESGRIREVTNGIITTVAGDGTQGFSGDNRPAAGARLNWTASVAVDAAGNVYIADTYNDRIRILTRSSGACPSSVPRSPLLPSPSDDRLAGGIQVMPCRSGAPSPPRR